MYIFIVELKRSMKDRIVNKSTPRWIIFVIDVFISMFSLFVAYLLRFNFDIELVMSNAFKYMIPLFLLVRSVSFILGSTYAGIIRYTSGKDAERIFMVTSLGTLSICVINFVVFAFVGSFVVPFSVVVVEFLCVIFLMTTLRIFVKILYHSYISNSSKRESVVIYGSDEFGIMAKRAFDSSLDTKTNIVAFIDHQNKKVGSKLEGIKIYSYSDLESILATKEIDKLVIAKSGLDTGRKQDVVDLCLNANVKACEVPGVNSWVNGELSARQIRAINIEDLLERDYDMELALAEEQGFYDFDIVIGDVRNKKRLSWLFDVYKPDIIYHAAAYKHVPMMEENPSEAIRTNVLGTRDMADLAVEFNAEAFVMVSTDKAVNPTNVMGASKRLAEIYIQSLSSMGHKTQFVTTRFGNVLGSNGSVIPRFKAQIEKGGPLTVTHREITRFFMTIPEACQLVLQAGAIGESGKIFIFDMGRSVKICDLAKKMIKLSGLVEGVDINIEYTGLRPGEKLYEELLNVKESTIETEHDRIMIAKVRSYDYKEVNNRYKFFETLVSCCDNFKIVAYMKSIVPEFISRNSIYEQLDDERMKKSVNA